MAEKREDPEVPEGALADAREAAGAATEELRKLHRPLAEGRDVDANAVVTEAEYAAEEAITRVLRSEGGTASGDYTLVFEEEVVDRRDGEHAWLVDPLDGAGSFRSGDDEYAVSIALCRAGVPVLGVVAAPGHDRLFTASVDDPAECDGAEISTASTGSLEDATLVAGYDRGGRFLRSFTDPADRCLRRSSAPLNLCDLARGEVDGHWEFDTYPWDVAAGLVVARRAGATVTDAAGGRFDPGPGSADPDPFVTRSPAYLDERRPLLASNGAFHDDLVAAAQSLAG